MRRLALVVAVVLAAPVIVPPAVAAAPPAGSANFTPPGYVPDYFSNESGPFRGGAAHAGEPYRAPYPGPAVAAGSRASPTAVVERRRSGRYRIAAAAARRHQRFAGLVVAHSHAGRATPRHRGDAATRTATRKEIAAKRGGAPAKTRRLAHASG